MVTKESASSAAVGVLSQRERICGASSSVLSCCCDRRHPLHVIFALISPLLPFLPYPITDVPRVALSLKHQMDRLQRQQSKRCCRRLIDSLQLIKILRRDCTSRTVVVRSILFSPLFLIISLRQTSETQLYCGANQGIHCADYEVSSILVVSSIPYCFPNSYRPTTVLYRSHGRMFSHLCFSSFFFSTDVPNAALLNHRWRRNSKLHLGMCCCCRHSSLFCVYYPFGILLFSYLCFSTFLFDSRNAAMTFAI
jgi:hypothetical protein